MFSDAHTVDMQERYLLCGSSQSALKPWVSKKYSQYLRRNVHLPLHTCIMYRSNVTSVIGGSVLTVMI